MPAGSKTQILTDTGPSPAAPRSDARWHVNVLLVASIGMALSFTLFGVAWRQQRSRIQEAFAQASAVQVQAVQDRVAQALVTTRALVSFYAAAGEVSRDQFRQLTVSFLSWQPELQALEWVPRVTASQRLRYETEAQRDGLKGYEFTEAAASGLPVRAPQREEYFAVYYVQPTEGNERALGFNNVVGSGRWQALSRACDTGQPIASEPIRLIQAGQQLGFLVAAPVYRKGSPLANVPARRANLAGFVVAVFRIDKLVETSLASVNPAGFDIHIFDCSDRAHPQHLYTYWAQMRPTGEPPSPPDLARLAGSFGRDLPLTVAGRIWRAVCLPTPAAIRAVRSWYPWATLGAGLLVTLTLASYLLAIKSQTQRGEDLVKQLLASNHALDVENAGRKAMENELRTAARIDRLTGLPNRVLLSDRLQQAIHRAARHGDFNYAVLFLDVDRFKLVNDSLGHEIGDELLAEIGRRLRGEVRAVDSVSRGARGPTAARLGGDEFVILLDGLHSDQEAQMVAQRLLVALSRPYRLGEHELYTTASIGIVTGDRVYQRAEDVIRDADTAMYEAKSGGKGRIVTFDSSMRQRVQLRLTLENDFRRALEAGQFLLHYQPIVSLETGDVESYEALVRWRHPGSSQLVPPGDFIPLAEETGLIVPLDEWVLREACRQLRVWHDAYGPDHPRAISVNLSRNQLLLPDLANRLRTIVTQSGVDPAAIHLEITETGVMQDMQAAANVLRQIKQIGFKLDLDDFGTGCSSLACLHQFPIDVLKIDRSFIASLGPGQDLAALVSAIIMLARNLGIAVIAEGVETPEQVAMLQSLECQFAQGYLFGKPLPPEQITPGTIPVRWQDSSLADAAT